jgi:hypothetical protein
MKKFLISILLLTILCSGSAFAWDKHPAAALGFDNAVVAEVSAHSEHTHNLATDGLNQDDHCSHASAHTVGIFYDAALKAQNAEPGYQVLATISLPYLYISPLLRPPIA